jgi:cell division protein FtsL
MIRALNLAMLALTVMICFGLYRVTHAAQEREADLRQIETQISEEERAIGVLKAEWTHLSQPSKMQAMATRYLNLEPMKATQIAYVNDLPMRPEATLSDIDAIPFSKTAEGAPIYDETAPVPLAKPQSVRR